MATSGDGTAPYQTTGAGGKFRKKPFRRNIPATPYDRPPTAIRNDNPSMLKKLVDPASRLISAGAHRLFDVFRKSLPSPSLKPPEINEEPQNVLHNKGGDGSPASISAATGVSELEVVLQQKTFTRSEVQRLTSLLHSKTIESPSDNSLGNHGDKRDDFHAAIATPVGTSRVLEEEIASPAELAKSYMGSRLTSQATRQASKLLPRTPITPVAQQAANSLKNLENGFTTPRSRGRSAMYTMARGPYSRSPTSGQQGVKSDYGHDAALTSYQGHAGKMALKRRSSVLDEDIGSGGPLRRIRQKANLISQSDKKELGYPVHYHPGGEGQNLLLMNEPEPKVPNYASVPTKSTQTANKILQHLDKPSRIEKSSVSTLSGMREKSPNELRLDMLHGQALRSLEKVDSPKFLPRSHDIQKPVASDLALQSNDKTEENGVSKFPPSHIMLTSVGGGKTDNLKGKAPIIEITDLSSKVIEEPRKRHAFQMSAPEDSFEMDDDDDIHDNGHVSLPLVENNKPETSAADIIKTPTSAEVSKTPELVENNKPKFSEVSKVPEQFELKKAENDISTPKTDLGSLGGSVRDQGLGFKIPVSSSSPPSLTTTQTSEFTQSTFQMEKNPPVKVSPFLFSANEQPNVGSDSKVTDSISVLNSIPKNDQVKFSVSNKDENGNWNGNDQKSTNMFGKSESVSAAVSAVTSTNGIFSFGTSTKNLSTSDATPDSNPPFPSLTPFTASTGISTTMIAISTTSAPAAISSASVSSQAFCFGSATSTASATSVAETGNTGTGTSSPFAITTFATTTTTTTTTTTGSGLFGFSSPAAATSTPTTTENGLFGFSSSAAATSTTNPTTAAGSGLFGVSSTAPPTSTTIPTTTTTGSGLFGFSSAAPTSTTTTTGSGPFGFSSSAAATSTTGSGLFGFSSPAAATSTTNTGNGPFGFSSSAAATSTTSTGSGLFGFSSPAAATSTTTAGSGLFGFSSPAASTSTTTTTATGSGLFGFGSSAAATTAAATTGSGLFSFGSSTAATSTTTSQSQGSFFNITNGNASSTSTLFGSSAPAFGSSTSFGITSVGPTSETKPGNSTGGSTTSVFGSTWQQPQQSSGFGSTFTSSPSPSVFSFGAPSTPTPSFVTAGASSSSFGGSSVFGNSAPVFGAVAATSHSNNNNNNSDQMSMEDSMAEDSMQTHSPVSTFGQASVSPFGQAPVSTPGFMFGQATPTPTPTPALNPPAASFSFGGQPNQAPPPQNPFQSSSVEFNAGGGSFSLGSGGDKSNRRIVRVMKSKNRKK